MVSLDELHKELSELKQRLESLLSDRNEIDAEISQVKKQAEGLREKINREEQVANHGSARSGFGQYAKVNTYDIDELPNPHVIINRSSPIQEKYRLFKSLFAGRPDVHAKRYESAKSSGYTPHCINRFAPQCPKKYNKKAKCAGCEEADFPEITFELFCSHLRGSSPNCNDVLGAYPLDADDLCSFIVADFDDKHNGEGDVDGEPSTSYETMRNTAIGFYKTCHNYNIPAHLEISRSGHGLHVWLFFSEPVRAFLARRLYSSVLTMSMNSWPDFDLSAYDRFIPSQDVLAKGGFGNLVALPLQGKAGRLHRSVFVDEELRQFADQFEYLSRLKNFSEAELTKTIQNFAFDVELGDLVPNEKEEDLGKPWERKKAEISLSGADFRGQVLITSANMLHVEKCNLSPKALNRIRRLAAFKNPQFYEHQRMRISTWNIPRIISTSEETEDYLSIPRGAYAELIGLLDAAGAQYSIDDRRNQGVPLDVEFTQSLREEQVPAARALLAQDTGVLHATTAFGKTVIGNYLIAERKVNTLVLVGTQQLLNQWKESLGVFLEIRNAPATRTTPTGRLKTIGTIGEYGGNKKQRSHIVDVAMMQSLYRNHEVKDFVKDYGMVIVDECHHVPASTFEAVLKQVNAKYVYGLTATPMREDGHHAILFLECGPIRYKVDAKKQAEQRPFEHYMIPRFTNMHPSGLHDEKLIPIIINGLMIDERRNKLLLEDISSAIERGRQPLVLSERTEHVNMLARALSGVCDNVIALTGTMSNKRKREINEQLTELQDHEQFVLISTGKYIGEGFDFPRLDTLFITMPISASNKVTQHIGRLHRLYKGKQDVLVYDYVDINIPALEKMYHKRLKSYKAAGYKVLDNKMDVHAPGYIFDTKSYWDPFIADCSNARSQIVIANLSLTAKKVSEFLKNSQPTQLSNKVVTVITKPIDAYSAKQKPVVVGQLERLSGYGIKVYERESLHQSFVVIDQEIVWFGNINPLGYCNSDSNIIRINDENLATALLESV